MTKPTKHLFTIFFPVLLVLTLYLFWEAITGIPKMHSLWSLDASPLYNHDFKAQTWRELTGRAWRLDMLGMPGPVRVFQPDDILKFILPPLVYHLATWIGSFLVMAGAMIYFLYSYGIKGLKAAIPALAYAFSGYTFTLISAGHWGTPKTMGYAVLAMALVRNGIRKRTIIHFILAALASVYGIINQMDVMGFLFILMAAYGLLQLILAWPLYRSSAQPAPSSTEEPTNAKLTSKFRVLRRPSLRLVLALILAATTFLIVAYPFLSKTFGIGASGRSTFEHREDQIERTGGNRWEFITNWSMPPEQVLEFIAPSVFGRETSSEGVPYWGRLGQTMNWPETKRGFRNFRQHNLYVGGIQLTLALYALFILFRRGAGAPSREHRIEIAFWWGATILTLLLACGRYFPLYRLVFHIPVLNKIRCPVKWFHLTEITFVILMGFGLTDLWNDLKDRRAALPRRFAFGAAAAAGMLFLSAGIAQGTAFGLQAHWNDIGVGTIGPRLRTGLAGSLFHGGLVLAALSAILFFVLRRTQTQNVPHYSTHHALAALLLVLAVDLGLAHKPFIHVRDVSAYYAPNPIADIALEHEPPYRMADYLSSREKHDPLWRNFTMKGVDILLPQAGRKPPPHVQALFDTLRTTPLRLWQVTSTRYIIGARQEFQRLTEHPEISVRASFSVTREGVITHDNRPTAPYVLLEYAGALPRVQLYKNWEAAPDEPSALRRLASLSFMPSKTVVVVDSSVPPPAASPAPATSLAVTDVVPGCYRVNLVGDEEGLILATDRVVSTAPAGSSCTRSVVCNGLFHGQWRAKRRPNTVRLHNVSTPTHVSMVAHMVLFLSILAYCSYSGLIRIRDRSTW